MKKFLFIIDPQNDFIEGGALPVKGGKEALENIANSGILNEDFEKIYVTLDTHYPTNLAFGEPKTKLGKYLERNTIRPTKWPPHCIKDTHGWEITEPLFTKLLEIDDEKIKFITKGESDIHESYSFLDIIYGNGLFCCEDNTDVISDLFYEIDIEHEEVVIYWTGLATDYCVLSTIQSIIKRDPFGKIKHILLSDMTAAINPETKINEKNLSITSYRS